MGSRKLNKRDTGEKIRSLLRQHGRALLGLLVLALVVHDIFGTHGYLAMRRTQQEIKKVKAELDQLNTENLQLAQEVELGLARPGEVIIKIPQSQRLPQHSAVKP